MLPPFSPTPSHDRRAASTLGARFAHLGGATRRVQVRETGVLRLRLPHRDGICEGVVLNTGGGVLGGDRLDLRFDLGERADVVLTTVAAEKVYRSDARAATVTTQLVLGADARLAWLPQETILFDGAHIVRSLTADVAADASLLAAETLVFGRLAMGETAVTGILRDSWRVRRAGHLVFADETQLAGAQGAILDRPATGNGARAVALVLLVAPDAETRLDPLRAALAPFTQVEAGASAFDGILVARLLSCSPAALRAAMVAALPLLGSGRALPRVWQ